jgi:2-C-methyl-D-erythritol 4-phosphate cytidylyltransferase
MSRTAAILLAAGSGKRMQGVVADKVLATVQGRPVFAYSATAFMESAIADLFVIVYRDRHQMLELAALAPTPSLLVAGGRERQDSVRAALAALPPDIAYVFIHDCARPLVRPEQLVALHKIVRKEGAVVLAHRVTDTIKSLRPEKPARAARGKAQRSRSCNLTTVDRSRLWGMETPQVFERSLIDRGYAAAARRSAAVTDDAATMELIGHPVALLENAVPNPKLTTPGDFSYIEFLLGQAAEDEG